jgi:hypothetical protein
VDEVAESRQSTVAPTAATAAILALTTRDRSVGHPTKHVADDDDIDAFAEGRDLPATAAVGRRKRPHRGNTLEDIVNDDDNEPASTRSSYWPFTLRETNASNSATSAPGN